VDGAKRGIRDLKYLGHRITWLTSPYDSCPDWGGIRNAWIRQRFGGDSVIIERNKEKIDGDVLVDDKPDNIRKWKKAHPVGHAILFETQFNRDFEWRPRATWSTMVRLFAP
jgi:5'(3')-deoxyribonucleotidase